MICLCSCLCFFHLLLNSCHKESTRWVCVLYLGTKKKTNNQREIPPHCGMYGIVRAFGVHRLKGQKTVTKI